MDKLTALKYISTKKLFDKSEINSDIVNELIYSGLVDKTYTLTKDQYIYNLTEKGITIVRKILFDESMVGYAINKIKEDYALDISQNYINDLLNTFYNENKGI